MRPLDDAVDALKGEGAGLSAKRQALLEACTAQRLRSRVVDVGVWNVDELDPLLDLLWSGLTQEHGATEITAAIQRVEDLTPHADDSDDELNGLGAQAACVALDSGLRCLLGEGLGSLAGQEYRFELARSAATMARFGLIQLGSGVDEERFERTLMQEDAVREELARARADLDFASGWHGDPASLAEARRLCSAGQ